MKKLLNRLHFLICFSGIWILPAGTVAFIAVQRQLQKGCLVTAELIRQGLVFSFFLMMLNLLINLATFENGKRHYHLLDALDYRNDPYMRRSKKRTAMRPPVPEVLKKERPSGIVLGKRGKLYVCNDPTAPGAHHTMVLGTTGCGKTSTVVLDTILCNPQSAIFAIDIKGELHEKGTRLGDPEVLVISPARPGAFGYDPFFALKGSPDEQLLVETMQEISLSLIPINPKAQNPFWETSARDLLCALLLFHYRRGDDNLIDIVDDFTGSKIDDVIDTVFCESKPNEPEHRLITRYVGMATETLSGITAQMMTALSIFVSDQNIRRMFRENPFKASPEALNEGKSMYLVIEEAHLERYARVVHLIFNQTVSSMERRREGSKPVLMIIDELARILSAGRMAKLENSLETLRSRSVSIMLISQSLEALERAYSKADIEAIMNNCPYKVILSATSKETQGAVIRWAGKYEEYKYSRTVSSSGRSGSLAYEEKNVVEAKELITLPEEGECIIITPYGYNRIRKAPYYQEPYISKIAAEITAHNRNFKEVLT